MRELYPYYKNIIKLATPVIISQVGSMSVGLADTIMVGRLGAEPLAAVAFSNSLSWIVFISGIGMSMGLIPLVGRSIGRGDKQRAGSLLANSFVFNTILGILFTFVIYGLSLLMDYMGQDPEIIPIAREYNFYQVLSMLPLMLYLTGSQFLAGLGNTFYSMIIMISSNVINIFLNFIFIYGYLDFPAMGAAGAGASTFISRLFCVFGIAFILFCIPKYREYVRIAFNSGLSRFRMRRLINIGMPIAGQMATEMLAIALMAIAIGSLGAEVLAAHQVALNVPSISFMVVEGLAAATTILVSHNYGLRLVEPIRNTLRASRHIITVYMIFSAIMMAMFATPIAWLFTIDADVVEIASYLLLFGAMFQIPDGIQGVTLGALRGIMVVKRPMYSAMLVYAFIGTPMGYLLCFVLGMGASGVWLALITSLIILSILYNRTFNRAVKSMVS